MPPERWWSKNDPGSDPDVMPPAQAAASPSAAIAAGPRLEERPAVEAIAPRQGREIPSAIVEVGGMMVLAARALVRGLRGPYDYLPEFIMQFRFVLTLALLPLLLTAFALSFGPTGIQASGFLGLLGALDRLGSTFELIVVREPGAAGPRSPAGRRHGRPEYRSRPHGPQRPAVARGRAGAAAHRARIPDKAERRMNWRKLRQNLQFLLVLAAIAVVGTTAAVAVLLDERLPNPFSDTYDVKVELSAANGVVPGYGQPVNVAGVPVGTISGARIEGGKAPITMAIRRGLLPHVYRDATAALEPVTPLKDMEMELAPGHPSAGRLGVGSTIPVADTTSPGELEDLLGALDGDTRSFLASLITSLGTGTAGQGQNMRRLLVALGPTAHQTKEISVALAARRAQIAQLVHNLSVVTRAASQDGRLAQVVEAGNATLHAVATQDVALRRSIAQLPSTLQSTGRALHDVSDIARVAGPTLTALTPAVKAMPKTLQTLGPFSATTAEALRTHVRPFVRDAQPTLRELAPAATQLTGLIPHLESITKVLQYATNELAYNPGGGYPGMLFWLDWAAHNVDSATGNEDAQGSIARTLVLASCQQATSTENLGAVLGELLGVKNVCERR